MCFSEIANRPEPIFDPESGLGQAPARESAVTSRLPFPDNVDIPDVENDKEPYNPNPCIDPDDGYSVGLHATFFQNVFQSSDVSRSSYDFDFLGSEPDFERKDCPNHLMVNMPL